LRCRPRNEGGKEGARPIPAGGAPRGMPTSRRASALGLLAILLWSTLATLTVLKGPLPPLQTTAIAFAIGGVALVAIALLRRRHRHLKPTAASLALGIYGLFGYHALYFWALRLAPPAEAHLISSLWALLIVLFSLALPGTRVRGRHIAGALMGFAAATLLTWGRLGGGGGGPAVGVLAVCGLARVLCVYLVWLL